MVPQLVMMWMAANVFNDWTSDKTGPWYNHSPLWANFIVLGAIFAFIQALSHTPEPLPPRVTRTAHWISIRSFIHTHSKNPLYIAWVFILQAIFGTIDEVLNFTSPKTQNKKLTNQNQTNSILVLGRT